MLRSNRLGPYGKAVIAANSIFVVASLVLLWACWQFSVETEFNARVFAQNVLLCLFGAMAGWGTGILATPIRKLDEARFEKLGKIISAFLAGYVVSKLDRLLETALFGEDALLASSWERAGLVVTSFLVMLIVVFINRSYLHGATYEAQEVRTPNEGAA